MKTAVLLLIILASTFGEEETRISCPQYDIWMGSDLVFELVRIELWEDCGRHCADTSNCRYWSWGGNYCYLYESSADLNIYNGFISGDRDCPEDQEYKEDI